MRVEGLPGRVAEERIDSRRLGPAAPFGAQDDGGARGDPGRLLGRPGLDGPRRGALAGGEVGEANREVEEGGERLQGHGLAGPPGHGERRGELVEHLLQPGDGVQVPPGEVGRAAGRSAPSTAPIDEGAQTRGPPGRGGGRRQGSEGPAQVPDGVGASRERQALSPRPPRAGEESRPAPQPLLRIAAPVERTGAVEQEAQARMRIGRAQVRRCEERLDGRPVDRTRRPERGAQVSNQGMVRERAGPVDGQRDAEPVERTREQGQHTRGSEYGDLAGLERVLEQGRREARRGIALLGVAGRWQPHHPAPGDRTGGRELDADVALDRELVERFDAAQPGLGRRGAPRLLREDGYAREYPPRPGRQRHPQVERGTRRGEETFQDQQAEVARLLRHGPPARRVGSRAERPGRVERAQLAEPFLVPRERQGGRLEPLRHAPPFRRGRRPEVGGSHLAASQLGDEPRRSARGTTRRPGTADEAGVAGRPQGEQPLRQGAEHGPAIPGGGEQPRDEPAQRGHPGAEEHPSLRVAEAALDPGLPELGGDDDENRTPIRRIRRGSDASLPPPEGGGAHSSR